MSAFESALLADGDSSTADVYKAFDATVACLKTLGFENAKYLIHLPWDYEVMVSGSGSSGAVETCEAEYLDAVIGTFVRQHGPTPDEIERVASLAAACARASGVEAASSARSEDVLLLAEPAVRERCLSESKQLVIPVPGG